MLSGDSAVEIRPLNQASLIDRQAMSPTWSDLHVGAMAAAVGRSTRQLDLKELRVPESRLATNRDLTAMRGQRRDITEDSARF